MIDLDSFNNPSLEDKCQKNVSSHEDIPEQTSQELDKANVSYVDINSDDEFVSSKEIKNVSTQDTEDHPPKHYPKFE